MLSTFELVFGLNKMKNVISMNQPTWNKSGNHHSIIFHYEEKEKDIIENSLKFIKECNKKAVLSVQCGKNNFEIDVDWRNLNDFLDLYKELSLKMLFDGRSTNKEIICSPEKAKEYFPLILAMCNQKMYSGYTYDYKDKRITVFCD